MHPARAPAREVVAAHDLPYKIMGSLRTPALWGFVRVANTVVAITICAASVTKSFAPSTVAAGDTNMLSTSVATRPAGGRHKNRAEQERL